MQKHLPIKVAVETHTNRTRNSCQYQREASTEYKNGEPKSSLTPETKTSNSSNVTQLFPFLLLPSSESFHEPFGS